MFKIFKRKSKKEEIISKGKKLVTCSACQQKLVIDENLTILECFGNGLQHSFTASPNLAGIDAAPSRVEDIEVDMSLDEETIIFPPIALQ